MKVRNRGFIVYGTFPNEGGRKRNVFRKYEAHAKEIAAEWAAAGATDICVVRTDRLAFCEVCKRIVEFDEKEKDKDGQTVKVKVCPSCGNEIRD
jgi:hypothetical protein